MILENELYELSERRLDESGAFGARAQPSYRVHVAVFALFFAIIVILQLLSGAYRAEFGGYPDEPAHYVTSVMVRNYIAEHKLVSPMKFAQEYYEHYPKVAFGHWPPVFYVLQAAWMLLFSASRASVRLEIAFTSALLGLAVYHEARRWFRWKAALLAGLLTICLPLVQTYSDQEMAESLLVLTCFLSTVYFARFLETESWRPCLLFALFFSLAVLTKGSGWLLAFVPPIAVLLTRRFGVLRRPQLWVAGVIVGALCIPWQLMTMHLVEQGWTGGTKPSVLYTLSSLWQFLIILEQISGPLLSAFVLVGLSALVLRRMWKRAVAPAPAAMFAFLLGVWLFHSIVPAGVEDRKMVIAAPALVLFLFAGGEWVAARLPLAASVSRWRYALTAAVGALSFFVFTFSIPHDQHYGYREAAQFISGSPSLRNATMLVSSASVGEGLLISEMAMRQPYPSCVILRATKALAKVNWDASAYQCVFSTPGQILKFLDSQKVTLVASDNFESDNHFEHIQLLQQAIQKSGRFALLGRFSDGSPHPPGYISLYRLLPVTR